MTQVALNGVVQGEYKYRCELASGQVIHSIHDTDGRRIAEFLCDPLTGTSTKIREYIWADDRIVAVSEGGVLYFVRTDHIGRPVFATNGAGAVVWSASYLPFGGLRVSSGLPIDLRFPGQWFQSKAACSRTGCGTMIRRRGGICGRSRWGESSV